MQTQNQIQNIILLEFPDEVEIFLDHCRQNAIDPSGFLTVALQPAARVLCKEKKLPFIDTIPFFDNHSHIRAVKESERLTRLISKKLEFKSPKDEKWKYPLKNSLIDTFIYYSRFYINNYLRLIEILRGIKENYPQSTVYAIKKVPTQEPDCKGRWGTEPFLSKNDRFTASLTEMFCFRNDMNYKEITGNGTKPVKKPSWLKKISVSLVKGTARFFMRRRLRILSSKDVVLFAAPSYNLNRLGDDILWRRPDTVCAYVTQQKFSIPGYIKLWFKPIRGTKVFIHLDVLDRGPRRKERVILENLKASYREFMLDAKNEFEYEKCPLVDEFNKKVENDLLEYLYYLVRVSRGQYSVLMNLKPAIVVSPVAIGPFQSWGELCRQIQVPAIVIPQKGLLAPQNSYARIEEYYIGRAQVTDDFQYAASQSQLVTQYLNWAGYRGEILETANLIFSKIDIGKRIENLHKLYQEVSDEKKVIVYAPSMKSRKSCRFYVLESLDELLADISDVMAAVAQLPDTHLIIRIHPGEPITKKEIEALLQLPYNTSISDKGTFEDVLTVADLVISFSSTIIQESLLNGVPVILYDRWNRYNHLEAPHIDKETPDTLSASYYITESRFLGSSLRWILDNNESGNRSYSLFKDYVLPSRFAENFFNLVKQSFENNKKKN